VTLVTLVLALYSAHLDRKHRLVMEAGELAVG
jgi:hypothetical protein